MKHLLMFVVSTLLFLGTSNACNMYKITQDGKTMLGNNEICISLNTQTWFEPGTAAEYDLSVDYYTSAMRYLVQDPATQYAIIYDREEVIDTTEIELITKTLMDYIEGTANGEPDRIARAFHQALNLYTIAGDTLRTRSGQKYISFFKKGKKNNRIGSIMAIDYENDAASAKIKVIMPDMKRIYTDYLLLLKLEGHWKIIHKSYTYVDYPD